MSDPDPPELNKTISAQRSGLIRARIPAKEFAGPGTTDYALLLMDKKDLPSGRISMLGYTFDSVQIDPENSCVLVGAGRE